MDLLEGSVTHLAGVRAGLGLDKGTSSPAIAAIAGGMLSDSLKLSSHTIFWSLE